MGGYWWSIPEPLVDWVTRVLPKETVVLETGTYLGDSALLLSKRFQKVITFERDHALATNAQKRFESEPRILVVEGSTRDTFETHVPSKETPCLFWLDAHYSEGVTAGADDPCPLLHELSIIFSKRDTSNTVILIDDIREMIGGKSGWPTLVEVCAYVKENHYNGIFFDDVLVLIQDSFLESLLDVRWHSRAIHLSTISMYWNRMAKVASASAAWTKIRSKFSLRN